MHPSPEQRRTFGARFRELRTASGMAQPAMADALTEAGYPISYQAIGGWERGSYGPRFPEIVQAAERILGAEGELVHLLGFTEGEDVVERVSSLEERVAALEAAVAEQRRRRR